ncbi:hypothetical protein FB45DRAFT_1022984 [Roridomyces roridus]|uniref:Uncharacterized protein n=1 Tax=Roridomyces roridus TaxID=1738132 RepID=A0AAD7FQP1_9AGAR|nr:hypothetical protein FB45DRAFT_1022984 [Roridomyces roridus]
MFFSTLLSSFTVLSVLRELHHPSPLSAMQSLRIYAESLCILVPLGIGFEGLDAYLTSTPVTVNFTVPPPVVFSPILDLIPHPLFPNYTPLLDALEAHSSKPMVHLHFQSTSPSVSVVTLLDELVPPSPTPIPVADDPPTTVASAMSISPSLALIHLVMLVAAVALAAIPVTRARTTTDEDTLDKDIGESMALVVLGKLHHRAVPLERTRSLLLTWHARLLVTFPIKYLLRSDRDPRPYSLIPHTKLVRGLLIADPPPVVLATNAPGEMVDNERHVHPLTEELPPPRRSDRIRSTSENPYTNHKPVIPSLAQLPETLLLFAAASSSRARTCTAPGHAINISATLNPTGATVPHITPFDGPIPPPSPPLATPRALLADIITVRPVTPLIIYETPAPRRLASNHPYPHAGPTIRPASAKTHTPGQHEDHWRRCNARSTTSRSIRMAL